MLHTYEDTVVAYKQAGRTHRAVVVLREYLSMLYLGVVQDEPMR